MTIRKAALFLIAALGTTGSALSQTWEAEAARMIAQNRKSHIDANVPPKDAFEAILQRDLENYFRTEEGIADAEVAFTILNERPAQIGVVLPKYYLWVRVSAHGADKGAGAVIVAAVDRKAFDILYYAPATALRSSNEEISRFPEGLVPEIRRRAAPAD